MCNLAKRGSVDIVALGLLLVNVASDDEWGEKEKLSEREAGPEDAKCLKEGPSSETARERVQRGINH